MIALEHNTVKMVTLLINNGADVNFYDKVCTKQPNQPATNKPTNQNQPNETTTTTLLSFLSYSQNGSNALFKAMKPKFVEVLPFLIKHTKDINAIVEVCSKKIVSHCKTLILVTVLYFGINITSFMF